METEQALNEQVAAIGCERAPIVEHLSSNVTIVQGDCLSVDLPSVVDAVITDPPYGMNWDTDSRRFSGGESSESRGRGIDWGKIVDDDKPFDPSPWLDYPRVVLFGSNHYAQRLPIGTTLVWLKRFKFGTFLSDGEIGWMKGGHGVYCHQDAGMNGAGANFDKLHPTMKPVGLMAWCMERAKVPEGGFVLDPYMGSASTGIACIRTGRRFFGVEIEPRYFDAACERLSRELAQGRLLL